jgi:hypothetical protein
MTVEKKGLTKSELTVMWGGIFSKGASAREALDNLNTVQFKRLMNSEPLPAIALGSVLAALKTIATLAKGSGDATTLHAIADALEASAALPTNEEISGSRQQSFFAFTPALEKMFTELVAFCRN